MIQTFPGLNHTFSQAPGRSLGFNTHSTAPADAAFDDGGNMAGVEC